MRKRRRKRRKLQGQLKSALNGQGNLKSRLDSDKICSHLALGSSLEISGKSNFKIFIWAAKGRAGWARNTPGKLRFLRGPLGIHRACPRGMATQA